jgi:hypothetical protein
MSPAAVPSPDGRYVAYNTWRPLRPDDPARSWEEQGIERGDALAAPELRLRDLATGRDSVLADGAYSVAWRRDGALAYARGVERVYRALRRYETELVVRAAPDAPEVTWSAAPGRYVAVAWAGTHLLAYRLSEGEHVDTLVFDEPGRERVLVAGGTLVALSPDGSKAFVEEGAESGRPRVRVLDIASGETVAAAAVDSAVGYAGDWHSDLVVAPAGRALRVFRIGPTDIAVEDEVRLPAFPIEPRFADAEGRRVIASADGRFLDCDRARAGCAELRPDPDARGVGPWNAWHRLVYNPSRPR